MSALSVIIPVHPSHNRERYLGACLRSLEPQMRGRTDVEVILIGDGCSIRPELCPSGLEIRTETFTRTRGVLRARNRALRLARGRLVAFLDADCVTDERWLSQMEGGFDGDNVGGVAGRIVGLHDEDVYRDRIASEEYALPCSGMGNIAFRADALNEAGPFDERLCFGAEEVDLCWRVWLKGYQIRRAAGALVRHATARDAGDFFHYGVAARLLSVKYGKILRVSPASELIRLARYDGSRQTSDALTALFRFAQPWIVGAGYAYRVLLDWCRLAPRVPPIRDLAPCLSDASPRPLGLTLDSRRWIKPPHVVWWPVRDGCVVKNLAARQDYALAGVSARIWEGIVGGRTREEIVRQTSAAYAVDAGVLESDVEDFARQLTVSGLLSEAPSG